MVLLATVVLFCAWNSTGQAQTISISNLWSISTADGRAYVTSGATERGVAYNPVTGHLLLASRAVGLQVAILDANTGAELGFLDTTGISGGTFALSLIGVADDGAIYGGNLSGSATAVPAYRLYRWADETSVPVPVFVGNPGVDLPQRWGDTFDVRGAGTNTQVLIASQGSLAAILSPDPAAPDPTNTFLATRLDVTGITSGDLQKGVAFGTDNTFYGKHTGSGNVRYLTFDLGTGGIGTATLITNYPVATPVAGISVDLTNSLLAGVQTSQTTNNHQLAVYDISNPGSATLVGSVLFPIPNVATPNAVAGIEVGGGKIFAVDTANGVVAVQVVISDAAAAPSIVTQPVNRTAVEGGYVTFSVAAAGTKPLSYQWRFNDTNTIGGATNSSVTIPNPQSADAGTYSVLVGNIAGSVTSTNAMLAVTPSVRSTFASVLWNLSPGSRPYLTPSDNNQRGLAYNPVNTNLVVVSRSPTNAVYVLDARTGVDVRTLNVDPAVVTGGTFFVNMTGVADDGAVYVANLITTGGNGLKIYKWDNDSSAAVPVVVYGADGTSTPDSALRWGDTMDVRGSGNETQILLAARDGGGVAIFTTADGNTFSPTLITVADAASDAATLGVAFGQTNTYWVKSSGGPLRHVEFDMTGGTGTVLQTFTAGQLPGNILPIGVDASNNLLAGIALETPDNVRLFDIADLANPPVNLDTDFFPTDNANDNGTGSLDFASDRLYVLDTNNGLLALDVQRTSTLGPISISLSGGNLILTWNGPGVLQSSTNVATGYLDVSAAASPSTNSISGELQRFFRLRN